MGRDKLKLTLRIKNKIGRSIEKGMSIKNAVKIAGIHESTYYDWMHKGEAATSGQYSEFYKYIEMCKAKSEEKLITVITDAADKGDWKPAAWILERRFPDQWGKIDRLDISGKLKTEDETGPLTDEVIDARNQYLKAVSNAKKQNRENEKKR